MNNENKLNANLVQWKQTSFYLSAEEAIKCKKHQDANCFEQYILLKNIDGKWTATEKTKTIQTKFSWLRMTKKIANELAKVGYYQEFYDVVKGVLPGSGKMIFAYENEI